MSRLTVYFLCLSSLFTASCIPIGFGISSPPNLVSLTVQASVTEVDPATRLPRSLTGTISGAYSGTYSEQILEAFFDSKGNVIGASSLSKFTFDAPHQGTISSYNFAESVTPILLLDQNQQPVLDPNGNPTVIGLNTSATGSLLDGTGTFEGVFGELQTVTQLSFTGGDMQLGQINSSVSILITTTGPNWVP